MKLTGILVGGWVAAGAALTLAGCSGSSSNSGRDEAVPAPSASRPADSEGCATSEDLAAGLSDPRVTQIEIVGDCEGVKVSTALTPDQTDLALLVCDATAKLAYADATITGVSVTGETGTELVAGLRDQPCAPVGA